MSALLTALYLAAIVLANLSVAHFGPASTPYNAFLFIGLNLATRDRLHDLWGKHVARKVEEIEVDREKKVVSTPAYMFHTSISHVQRGIDRLVSAVLELA